MDGTDIQHLLDNPDSMGRVTLPEGEFEGKFFIRKSCTVNGSGTVLWNLSGPVLVVDAENVHINNVKVELTHDNIPVEQHISIYCRCHDTKFTDTEVNGALLGIAGEEQYWGIPKILSLGRFKAEQQQSFTMEIYSSTTAEISCGFHDITLSCDTLTEGYNTITLTVGKIKSGSLIYGNILIKSAVTRKIILYGEACGEDVPETSNYMLCTVDREAPQNYREILEKLDFVQLASMPEPEREEVEIPLAEIDEEEKENSTEGEENVLIACGKRIPLSAKKYRLELMHKNTKMDIDGYMFMLSGGKVSADKRMIFFGNDHSDCGSVSYLNAPDKRAMFVDFRNVPADVTHMVLLFSIYGDNPEEVFSRLEGAEVSILCENGVHMHLPLDKDINCKTILALGFECSEGIWEMIPSGKGMVMPLADICRGYGVTVV